MSNLPGAIDFETPPVAFYFKVNFLPSVLSASASVSARLAAAVASEAAVSLLPIGFDTSFHEVSGLDWSAETEEFAVGGRMETVSLLKGIKYSNLVLKREITPISSPLVIWCNALVCQPSNNSILPATVIVNLLDAKGYPSRAWVFDRAYPIAWAADAFSSNKNEVAIESVTLKHSGFIRIL